MSGISMTGENVCMAPQGCTPLGPGDCINVIYGLPN